MSVVLLGVMLSIRKVWETDYWWQWATGRWILQHGIPRTDPFSFTNPGHERLELRWLYCVWLYLTTTGPGIGAAILTKTAAVISMFAASAWAAGAWWRFPVRSAFILTLAVVASSQRFMLRPETASYLFFALFLLCIERLRRGGGLTWIGVLAGVQMLWANIHGMFALGPALVGAWLAGEAIVAASGLKAQTTTERPGADNRYRNLKRSAMLLALVLGVCLVNPYHVKGLWLPLQQFLALHGGGQKGFFAELTGPFTLPDGSPPPSTTWGWVRRFLPRADDFTAILAYKCLIAATFAVMAMHARRLHPYHWLLVGSQFYLSVTGVRNLPLFALASVTVVLSIIGADPAPSKITRWATGMPAPARVIVALGLLFVSLWQSWRIATDRFSLQQGDSNQFGLGIASYRYPVDGSAVLEQAGITGPIFNSPGAGSYLLSRGLKVFIDPRGEVYEDAVIAEYLKLVNDPGRLDEFTRRYDLRVLFLEPENYSLQALARAAHAHPRWRLAHLDSTSMVFLRDDTAPDLHAISVTDPNWEHRARSGLPAPRPWYEHRWWERLTSQGPAFVLARACANLGGFDAARRFYEDCLRISPEGFPDYGVLSKIASNQGDHASAARYAAYAALEYPDAPGSAELAVRAAGLVLELGDAELAARCARVGIRADPEYDVAYVRLAQAELALARPNQALVAIERADALRPGSALTLRLMGRAKLLQGDPQGALRALERAMELGMADAGLYADAAAAALNTGRTEQARRWAGLARDASGVRTLPPGLADTLRSLGMSSP